MQSQAFLSYRIEGVDILDDEQFLALSFIEQKEILIATLDMNHLYVNFSEIDDQSYDLKDIDKKMSKLFYGE